MLAYTAYPFERTRNIANSSGCLTEFKNVKIRLFLITQFLVFNKKNKVFWNFITSYNQMIYASEKLLCNGC